MTKERLQELATEAGLPLSKFLLIAKAALDVPMAPSSQLVRAICDKASEIGDEQAEILIKDALP